MLISIHIYFSCVLIILLITRPFTNARFCVIGKVTLECHLNDEDEVIFKHMILLQHSNMMPHH